MTRQISVAPFRFLTRRNVAALRVPLRMSEAGPAPAFFFYPLGGGPPGKSRRCAKSSTDASNARVAGGMSAP